MKIKFLGAASGIVTGSSYVLTSGSGRSILIDLGMFQGTPEVDKLNYEKYDYDAASLVGAVLTHAHLDHCGRLPIVVPKGFSGEFWMTPETKDLTSLSLFDTAKIAKNSDKPILFNEKLVEKTIKMFRTVNYHETFEIGDFTIKMYNAGHILGSASLEIEDKATSSQMRKIIFSGDLGNSPEPLEKETENLIASDVVVIESTYGDRLHPAGDPAKTIQDEINKVEVSGGTLLIPAFSLERSQEILHIIMHLKKDNKISPSTPIFLDSPMAQKATDIYINYAASLNLHILDDFKSGSPFEFPGLNVIKDPKESSELYRNSGAQVIIAGSGMMVGGRIVGHAAQLLPLASTRLLIVGYQGEGTLGRELLERNKKVKIAGVEIEVMANITDMQTMSSHADQNQLLDWLKPIQNVKKVFITHGEEAGRNSLSQKIRENLEIKDITLPLLNQAVEF